MNDMREIQDRAEAGDPQAQLAMERFCYRIKKYIGAYTAVLGRIDAVVFTGGIGENSPRIRSKSCEGLGALGFSLDEHRNNEVSCGITQMQSRDSHVKILVIPTDEEREIAQQTIGTIRRARAAAGASRKEAEGT